MQLYHLPPSKRTELVLPVNLSNEATVQAHLSWTLWKPRVSSQIVYFPQPVSSFWSAHRAQMSWDSQRSIKPYRGPRRPGVDTTWQWPDSKAVECGKHYWSPFPWSKENSGGYLGCAVCRGRELTGQSFVSFGIGNHEILFTSLCAAEKRRLIFHHL